MILKNIALFVPLGYYLVSSFSVSSVTAASRKKAICATIMTGAVISLVVEAAQYFSGRGVFDLNDLLNNVIGMILGVFLFLSLDRVWNGRLWLETIVSALLICVGVIGCFLIIRAVRKSNTYIDQFEFDIYDIRTDDTLTLSGCCKTWFIDTPPYKLFLKSEDGLISSLDTAIDDDSFTAVTETPSAGKYEILIEFQGYKRLDTQVFINGDHVEYVEGDVRGPEGIDLSDAVLKAYTQAYDTFVYQRGNSLIWLIGCELDNATSIIYQLRTNEPGNLPENRIYYGFDNRGFKPGSKNEKTSREKYRIFEAPIPEEYNITAVLVGFSVDKRVTWSDSFRIVRNEMPCAKD